MKESKIKFPHSSRVGFYEIDIGETKRLFEIIMKN
jgi:hypothetical protein